MLRSKAGSKQDYATPWWLYKWIDTTWGPFILDAAATAENKKCEQYYNVEVDGLCAPWVDGTFINPPWGDITPWVRRADAVGTSKDKRVALLLPSNGMTSLWYRTVAANCATKILAPRIDYGGGAPSGGSMVLLFGYVGVGGDGSVEYIDLAGLGVAP